MAGQGCDKCMYSVFDPQVWRRALWTREPILPRCANHPQWPGRMHDVPGVPCRNYRPKPVLPKGDGVRLIPLGDGFYAYVDASDYEWLSRYTWHLSNGYAFRWEKGRRIYMHSDIMQPPTDKLADHVDSNRANNCRSNLRVCTQAENLLNTCKRHGTRSRFKGVFYDMRFGKWFAQCRLKGKRHWRGYFDDESEAARAYDHMAVELFGEFARLNFPEEWPAHRRQELYAQRDAAKTEGKKVGRKEGKTTPAKPRATRAKDEPNPTRRKTKDRKGEDSAKIINRKSSIINPKGTPGRRDRRHTTTKKAAGRRP